MGDARIAVEQRVEAARPGERVRRSTGASRRAAAFAVWYLRTVAFINFLSAAWVSLGQDVRRHNQDDFFTPYLLTAGFASGVFTAFLAITMRRRKRAAWILNLVMSGLFLALFAFAMAFPEIRRYAQNWVSLALTAAFVAALLVGRREFYAKGDRSNPRLAATVAVGGGLVASLLAGLLVTVTDQAPDAARATFPERWHYGTLRLVSVAAEESRFPGIDPPNWANVAINVLSTALVPGRPLRRLPLPGGPSTRSPRTTRCGCVHCWSGTASATRSATSRCAGRRVPCGRRRGRRPSSTGWWAGVSLASGDPIGDPEAWPGAIVPWLAQARAHGWIPAVMGASEEAGTVYSPARSGRARTR